MAERSGFDYSFLPKINIKKKWIIAFASAFVAGFFTHIYALTNMLADCDSILENAKQPRNIWIASLKGATTGRWLVGIPDYIVSWFRTPVTAGLIILVLMGMTAVLTVEFLEIESRAGMILTGAMIGVSPSFMASIVLRSTAYPISVLLGLSALMITKKYRKGWIAGVFLLCMTLAIMPVNISCILILLIYWLLKRLCSGENDGTADLFRALKRYVLMGIGGCIIYLVITFVLMRIFNTGLSSYQGASDAASVTHASSMIQNIVAVVVKTYQLGFRKLYMLPELKFSVVICYAIQAACVVATAVMNRIFKRPLQLIMLIITVMLIPFALCTITIMSPKFGYSGQHRYAWIFLFVGMLALVEMLVRTFYEKQIWHFAAMTKAAMCISCVTAVIMIYGQFLYCNIGYYDQQYVMERDKAFMTRILCALDQDQDFDYSKNPVYFMNILSYADSDTGISPLASDPDLYDIINPEAETDLWCYGASTIRNYMKKYEGIEFLSVPKTINDEIEVLQYTDWRYKYADMKLDTFKIVKYKDTDVYIVMFRSLMPASSKNR